MDRIIGLSGLGNTRPYGSKQPYNNYINPELNCSSSRTTKIVQELKAPQGYYNPYTGKVITT